MSRYPGFGQPAGLAPEMSLRYDQSLVASAPAVSRAERQVRNILFDGLRAALTLWGLQEGYNIDILERGPYPSAPTKQSNGRTLIVLDDPSRQNANVNYSANSLPRAAALPPFESTPSYEAKGGFSPPPLADPYGYGKRTPWWRTKKGIIILGIAVVLFIGIIAGVIAGVVTRKKGSSTASSNTSSPLNDVQSDSVSSTASERLTISRTLSSATRAATVPFASPTPTDDAVFVTVPDVSQIGDPDADDDEDEDDGVGAIGTPTPTAGNGNGNGNGATGGTNSKPTICRTFPNLPACQ